MKNETHEDYASSAPRLLLTAGQTQRALCVSDATLKRLSILGALEPVKFSREKRYRRKDVEAFIDLGPEKLSRIAEGLGALSRSNKARARKNQIKAKK